jgi:hypothetical protein
MRSPTEEHHGPATPPVVGRAGEAARIPPPHWSPDHRATRTPSTLWLTRDCIAPTLRTQRQSKPSRTPTQTERIKTEVVSRNPLCKIRTNFINFELKLRIESAKSPNFLRQTLPPINWSSTQCHCHPNTSRPSSHRRPDESRPPESSYCLEEGCTLSPAPSK